MTRLVPPNYIIEMIRLKKLILFGVLAALLFAVPISMPFSADAVRERPEDARKRELSFEKDTIGYSVEGRPLERYTIGSGERDIILIGGIHGGSEWNTVVLVRQLVDHYYSNFHEIPADFTIHFIPLMNPDGLYRVTGGKAIHETDFSAVDSSRGRFNGRWVDLNRNWDNNWQPVSNWKFGEVDAGTAPFSEPETAAVRDFVFEHDPELVIFYHCAANGIWYGGRGDPDAPAAGIARIYSDVSGYRLPEPGGPGLVSYRITGAASGYWYKQGIPSITVELETAYLSEFDRNLSALSAVLDLLH